MPEGPEVRRYADDLNSALKGKVITAISARTKDAKQWLIDHPGTLEGKRVERVFSYGKNIIFTLQNDFYLYSHQMMWGRWHIVQQTPEPEKDRRERARIVVDDNTVAMLYSAPIFQIGEGDPFECVEYLQSLGPLALLDDDQKFDASEFRKRLGAPQNDYRTIGSVLLDQTIVAGIGNYLRAEILFLLRMNPWRLVCELTTKEITSLAKAIPAVTRRAYDLNGVTITDELRERMQVDSSLVYVPGKEYGQRHYVFRRTNLPCLICANPIKQLRQAMQYVDELDKTDKTADLSGGAEDEDNERTRIVYFCPECQGVDLPALMTVHKNALKQKALQNKKVVETVKRVAAKTIRPVAKKVVKKKTGQRA